MNNNAALRSFLFALFLWASCKVCIGQITSTIQQDGGSQSDLQNQLVSETFFGTSHDAKIGTLAWLIRFDKDHQTGEMFVAPRMMKFSKFNLGESGTLKFQSQIFVGKEYRFKGTFKSETVSGEMQLVNAKSGYPIDTWEVDAVLLTPQTIHINSLLRVGDIRYSNAAYSSEGGDQTGMDIRFFSTNTETMGMIVFYESYWGEPTFTPLALSKITIEKGVIYFSVDMPSGIEHYRLRQTPKGGLLNRDDLSQVTDVKDIALKKSRSTF